MKVVIRDEKYILKAKIKEPEYIMYVLEKEGQIGLYCLTIYGDHYKLFRPLGDILSIEKKELKEIAFSLEGSNAELHD